MLSKIYKYRIFFQTFIFWMLVCMISGCGPGDSDDEVVARVGDAVLTREELDRNIVWEGMGKDQESEYVDRWINRELLYQEAKRLGLDESEELRWELELVEKEFLIQKLLERTFAQKVQITEEEIASNYENNKDSFIVDEEEVRAFHILTKSKETADLALREIQAGRSFDEVVRERSVGIFRERGGDMGYIRRGDVIPEVARYAFRLQEGQVSPVFQSNYGYHILKIVKKRLRGSYKDIVDVRDDILKRLRVRKEQSIYYDLLFQLQNKTNVTVTVPNDD